MKYQMTAAMAAGLVCAFSVIVPASAATYSLQPDEAASKDTFVYQFSILANSNLESPPYNAILGTSKTSTGHDLVSLVQFDLSSIAGLGVAASDVTTAKLKLRSTGNGLGGGLPSASFPVTVDLAAVTSTWDESTVTWNSRPSAGGMLTSASVVDATSLVEFDVTSLVQNWLDGTWTNFGMQLSQALEVVNGSGQRVGATFVGASGNALDRPILEITTVPEPTGLFLLATAGLMALRFRKRR